MEGNIPVPAESLRTLAENCFKDLRKNREKGREYTALSIEEAISEAMGALEGKDGEFVSISSKVAAELCASTDFSNDEAWRHADVVEVFLKQYGYWN